MNYRENGLNYGSVEGLQEEGYRLWDWSVFQKKAQVDWSLFSISIFILWAEIGTYFTWKAMLYLAYRNLTVLMVFSFNYFGRIFNLVCSYLKSTASINASIKQNYDEKLVKFEWEYIFSAIDTFIITIGRWKFNDNRCSSLSINTRVFFFLVKLYQHDCPFMSIKLWFRSNLLSEQD